VSARLDELIDPASIAGLLGLGASVVGGAPIAIVDVEGRLVGGTLPPSVAARRQPIELDGRVLGSVVADASAPPALAALIARSVELILAGSQRFASRVRLEHELAIGRRIQLALLPQRFPAVAGWSFAARYEAAREVGGDFYDIFSVRGRSDRLALLVADVTGKGIPAALLMADARALLHAAVDNADGPGDALGRVNRILVRERPTSLFVTAALLVADTATGGIRHASAGHEPLLVKRVDGRIEELEAEGPLLGAFDEPAFEERETTLALGELLVAYTDGITEARDPAGGFFGEERLRQLVGAGSANPDGVADLIAIAVSEFRSGEEAWDDLTLVVAGRD
jgi:sigma-B regulation protein RsbU (phosphoserine phosphatase)